MDIILNVLAAVLVLAGFAGIVLPALPDLPLMLAGLVLRSAVTGFAHPAPAELFVGLFLVVLAAVLDTVAAPAVAKYFGASRRGQLGALVGSLLSLPLIQFSPLFLVALPLIGTVAGELSVGKTQRQALKSSLGTALGIGLTVLVKALVGFFLLATLVLSFFRA